MTRTVGCFTGSRAEYGLLRSVLFQLRGCASVGLQLVVGGGHLAASQGMTIDEIRADGFPIASTVDMGLDRQPPASLCETMALALSGIGKCLERCKPDVLLLLGDRYETLCAAVAAAALGIPVAHIHGGETTMGAVDDVYRHAITKLSHWHFVSCKAHARRVLQMGEAPERIWNTGALGVENALTLPLNDEASVHARLGINGGPYVLCTFHPVTREPGEEERQMQAVLSAMESLEGYTIVFTGANADPGGTIINSMLTAWANKQPEQRKLFASLGVVWYLSAAKYAACVVGNSSSGVIEIPSLGTPVVDIGERQGGRIRSRSVLHCATDTTSIRTAACRALSAEHRSYAQREPNPYAQLHTSRMIARILCTHPLCGMVRKSFYDLPMGKTHDDVLTDIPLTETA